MLNSNIFVELLFYYVFKQNCESESEVKNSPGSESVSESTSEPISMSVSEGSSELWIQSEKI